MTKRNSAKEKKNIHNDTIYVSDAGELVDDESEYVSKAPQRTHILIS